MILVNLLPPEFCREYRRAFWRHQKVVKAGGIIFFLITGVFYIQFLVGAVSLKGLKSHWLAIQQDLGRVDRLRMEVEGGSRGERKFLENYVISPYPVTLILKAVSESLPGSIWLVELKVARQSNANTLLLQGLSRPLRDQSSVQEIEKYLYDLKGKFPGGTSLVLTTSRQQKDRMELTLFTAVFKW